MSGMGRRRGSPGAEGLRAGAQRPGGKLVPVTAMSTASRLCLCKGVLGRGGYVAVQGPGEEMG